MKNKISLRVAPYALFDVIAALQHHEIRSKKMRTEVFVHIVDDDIVVVAEEVIEPLERPETITVESDDDIQGCPSLPGDSCDLQGNKDLIITGHC